MVTKHEQQRRVRDYRARQSVHERRQRRQRRDSIVGIAVAAAVLLGGTALLWDRQGPVAAYPSGSPAASESALATEPPAPSEPAPEVESTVPDPSLAEGRTWKGAMTINGVELGVELDGAAAPQAASAVINDAKTGFYNGKSCHRLTTGEGFSVLQCGSVDGTGAGDPAYQYGPIENAPEGDLYPAGTIAMARAGNDAGSNGHQFFIVYGDTTIPSDSAGGYSVVGKVTSGLDQLISGVIAKGTAEGVPDGPPAEPVQIESIVLE